MCLIKLPELGCTTILISCKNNYWKVIDTLFFTIFKGKTVTNNPNGGTILANQSLVLQSVSRARAGIYTCVASNQEGDGESNPLYLDVKCEYKLI